MLKPYFIAAAILLGWLSVARGAEPKPKECDEAMALEGMRESRIEAEFNRRGISDPQKNHPSGGHRKTSG